MGIGAGTATVAAGPALGGGPGGIAGTTAAEAGGVPAPSAGAGGKGGGASAGAVWAKAIVAGAMANSDQTMIRPPTKVVKLLRVCCLWCIRALRFGVGPRRRHSTTRAVNFREPDNTDRAGHVQKFAAVLRVAARRCAAPPAGAGDSRLCWRLLGHLLAAFLRAEKVASPSFHVTCKGA